MLEKIITENEIIINNEYGSIHYGYDTDTKFMELFTITINADDRRQNKGSELLALGQEEAFAICKKYDITEIKAILFPLEISNVDITALNSFFIKNEWIMKENNNENARILCP